MPSRVLHPCSVWRSRYSTSCVCRMFFKGSIRVISSDASGVLCMIPLSHRHCRLGSQYNHITSAPADPASTSIMEQDEQRQSPAGRKRLKKSTGTALTFIMHSQNGRKDKNAPRIGRRHGPLDERGRKGMKVLKAKGGACWRCKILKKQVSLSLLGKRAC